VKRPVPPPDEPLPDEELPDEPLLLPLPDEPLPPDPPLPDPPFPPDPEELETVTKTVEVWVFPAASLAVTVIVCEPFDTPVLFQVPEYGAMVSSLPRLELSSLNCTPTTPTLSEAVATIDTAVPETVELLVGAVIETVGGIVSAGVVITPPEYS